MGSFDAASSGGSNADRFFRNGWLGWFSIRDTVYRIMHLDWRQSTEIGARRIEFTPLLCLGCHLRNACEVPKWIDHNYQQHRPPMQKIKAIRQPHKPTCIATKN
eukprot:scaffold395524_cov31-Attheya_sp.AAC.1